LAAITPIPAALPIHEAFNLSSAISLAENYRRTYGHSNQSGLPEVMQVGALAPTPQSAEIMIDQDIIIAAPIWHDWAKTIVFQWTAGGSEFPELNFGGNGKTDSYGGAGDSKTGGHHLIGLAETIKRGLPPAFVVAQASAHGAPTGTQEYKVGNWIRSGVIIAQVASRRRRLFGQGRSRFAFDFRRFASWGVSRSRRRYPTSQICSSNMYCTIFRMPTTPIRGRRSQRRSYYCGSWLSDMNDTAVFNTKFRNPVLSTFSAERLQIIYAGKGIAGFPASSKSSNAPG